jgi:hypothetical protein
MTGRWLALATVVVAGSLGCAQPEDIPSNIKDLRLLAMRLEPPELMAPACPDPQAQSLDPALLASFFQPIELRSLVLDPAGEGREITWTLWSCPSTSYRTCSAAEVGTDRVQLAEGRQPAGEWQVTLDNLAASTTQAGAPLLQRVWEEDPFRGLGGLRVPLFLHLRAGDEEIWGQKLMVYSCQLFPDMSQNVNPELPAILLGGAPWPADEVIGVSGPGPFEVEPEDFSERQEVYVVPSFELQPVVLKESWKIAWHADFGRFSPNVTGGADFGGGEARHRTEWLPPREGEGREVRFWFVVRDGRGGMSWTERRLQYDR